MQEKAAAFTGAADKARRSTDSGTSAKLQGLFFPPPHCISGCVVVRHQLAICAAQLKAGLRLDGRAVTTGDAAVYNLPFQLGFGEIAIQGH